MPLFTPPSVGRWLTPLHGGVASVSQTFTVGRVYLVQFEVTVPCSIDGLAYIVGATSAGNVTGGVVSAVSRTGDTPTAAPVVAQSASTAQGSANAVQVLTWTAVPVAPGIYYAGIEGSDVTGTYMRFSNVPQAPGLGATYDRGGGYGALTNPTPTATDTGATLPGIRIRIA